MSGLYIHIPVCVSKCRYCDFYRLPAPDYETMEQFIEGLKIELRRLPSDFIPQTVFLGGGTPTALPENLLSELLDALHESINLTQVVEFSSEANPGTLTDEKLAILRSAGVNRISLGVQSFDDQALQLLGRIYTGVQAEEAVEHVRAAGFSELNLDLIQSIPGMSAGAVLDDIRRAVALGVEHISSYNLIYEPGTPLALDRDAGRICPPTDDEEADNYFAVRKLLLSAGYEQYEISNFCKSGQACKHNLLYWQGGDYLGCGPSAHSHWKGARFGNVSNLQEYAERLQRNENPFDAPERLDKAAKARETLVMGLRLLEGVNVVAFEQQTGFSVDSLCGETVTELVEDQLLSRGNNNLRLTPEALFISNSVFSALI